MVRWNHPFIFKNVFILKDFLIMARKFVLREDQYNELVKEGVLPSSTPDKVTTYNGDDANIAQTIGNDIKKQGDNSTEQYKVVKGNGGSENQTTTVWERCLISKKELKENRLKKLRENSEIISVKDIFGL